MVDLDPTALLIAMILGSIGMGYLIYGKKQKHGSALIAGILLSVLPYCGMNNWLLSISGIILMVLPFFIGF